jgi:hypothetical protein
MTVRTFKQYGQGFGTDPVSIIAKINDVIVFEGDIPTVDESLPPQPDLNDSFENVLFSWENTVDFAGIANVEITVGGTGTLILTDTVANYITGNIETSTDVYGSFYSYNDDEVVISDPFTNPEINGVDVVRVRDWVPTVPLSGQWWYTVGGESTFTGTLNIDAGILPPAP